MRAQNFHLHFVLNISLFVFLACVPFPEFPPFLCGDNVLWPPGEHCASGLRHGLSCKICSIQNFCWPICVMDHIMKTCNIVIEH